MLFFSLKYRTLYLDKLKNKDKLIKFFKSYISMFSLQIKYKCFINNQNSTILSRKRMKKDESIDLYYDTFQLRSALSFTQSADKQS